MKKPVTCNAKLVLCSVRVTVVTYGAIAFYPTAAKCQPRSHREIAFGVTQ